MRANKLQDDSRSNRQYFRCLQLAGLAVLLAACAREDGLRVSGDRLFVPVTINGVSTEALLDSGAEMTLVDAAFAARLDLGASGSETARGTGGEQEVSFAEGVDIRAVEVLLQDRQVAILDLSDISKRLVGEPVHVILGRELFDAGRFYLDIEGGVFRRADDAAVDSTDTASDANLGVAILRNFRMTIDFPGKAVWLEPLP